MTRGWYVEDVPRLVAALADAWDEGFAVGADHASWVWRDGNTDREPSSANPYRTARPAEHRHVAGEIASSSCPECVGLVTADSDWTAVEGVDFTIEPHEYVAYHDAPDDNESCAAKVAFLFAGCTVVERCTRERDAACHAGADQ